MPWYEAKVATDAHQSKLGKFDKGSPAFVFFDPRSLQGLHADLRKDGTIEVERASVERRLEAKGKALLRDPFVVAILERRDLNFKHPEGPPPFVMRDYAAKRKAPVDQ